MLAYLLGNIESRHIVAIIDIHLGKLIDSVARNIRQKIR